VSHMRILEPGLANGRITFHGWLMPKRSLSSKRTRLDMHFTSLSPILFPSDVEVFNHAAHRSVKQSPVYVIVGHSIAQSPT